MTYAVLFPGQGSQKVGMAPDVFAARPDLLGPSADAILGWPLGETVAFGPEEVLTRTDRAQPALFAVEYALFDALAEAVETPPSAAAGHSLGEYTALAAAGVIRYWDGLRLVAARGVAMNDAAQREPSGMAALIGADLAMAEHIAADRLSQGGRLWVANINAPGQIVLAGGSEDIEWLVEHARDRGARRAVPLKVAGGFHSPFMVHAAVELSAALEGTPFGSPAFPVYANATAAPFTNPLVELEDQLIYPVRFAEILEAMAASGIDTFVHIGPGDVTSGLARRTVPGATVLSVSSMAEIQGAATTLSVQ